MDTPVRQAWTREDFFEWAQAQDERYEFDGFAPVAMTGGNIRHDRFTLNILVALKQRLPLGPCTTMGPNAGVGTIGQTVRYPDALVTCSPYHDEDHLAPAPIILFEVVSPTSGRLDRVVKAAEYNSIPSARRYVIVESASAKVAILSRTDADQPWTSETLVPGDSIALPEIGIEIPVNAIYGSTSFTPAPAMG